MIKNAEADESDFNDQELDIIRQTELYAAKEYLKNLSFLRVLSIWFLRIYSGVGMLALTLIEMRVIKFATPLLSWELVFFAALIIVFYERSIAFQIIHKLKK